MEPSISPQQPIRPTIGRIVHYKSYGTPKGEYTPECRAAIITAINRTTLEDPMGRFEVSLTVLNPTGMFFNENVMMDEGVDTGGQWHWPERTD